MNQHVGDPRQVLVSESSSTTFLCSWSRSRCCESFDPAKKLSVQADNILSQSGFTTRSDIGPAREVSSTEAGVGKEDGEGDGDDGDQFKNPEEEGGLFAGMVYDRDDEEADAAYEAVQKKMQERRKAKREAREAQEAEEYLKNNPRIQDRFSDLKRGLSDVSDAQWENLPDVSNFTGKRRKKQVGLNKTYVVPDSVLVSGRDKNMVEASLDERQMVRSLYSVPPFPASP